MKSTIVLISRNSQELEGVAEQDWGKGAPLYSLSLAHDLSRRRRGMQMGFLAPSGKEKPTQVWEVGLKP